MLWGYSLLITFIVLLYGVIGIGCEVRYVLSWVYFIYCACGVYYLFNFGVLLDTGPCLLLFLEVLVCWLLLCKVVYC